MASVSTDTKRMKTNATVAKILDAAATKMASNSIPKMAKTMLKGGTGMMGNVLLDAAEANAIDDVSEMKKWKPRK